MKKTLLVVAAALMSVASTMATSLSVVYLTGEEEANELAKIQRVDLTQKDGFSVVGTNGQLLSSAQYGETQKIVFKQPATGAPTNKKAKVQVYPNPTQDALNIAGAEDGCSILVVDMQGKQVYSGKANSGNAQIPVTGLSNGTYLLKVGSSVMKFIKE